MKNNKMKNNNANYGNSHISNNLEIINITTEIRSNDENSRKISGLAIPAESRSELFIDVVEEDIIRSDKQSQVNYLYTLYDKFIITRNELRKQLFQLKVQMN